MKNSADYSKKVLEVSHLKQYFKSGVGKRKLVVKAVDDISFDIYKKEVFGLVGESGCGKTTTGRSLIRLYRPTSGEVVLEGETIGSGADRYKENIRKEKARYRTELLKLNRFKYTVYNLRQEANKKIDKLSQQLSVLRNEYKTQIKEIRADVEAYENDVFNHNSYHKMKMERLKFNFTVMKERLRNQTKNEVRIERDGILEAAKFAFKQKSEGINDSAALSKKAIKQHLKDAEKAYKVRVKKIHDQFDDLVQERSNNLLSKEDYKLKVDELKKTYEKDKLAQVKSYKEKLASFEVPDYDEVRLNTENITNELSVKQAKIEQEMAAIKEQLKLDIANVSASKEVDQSALLALKNKHKAYIDEQKKLIRESNKAHWSRKALENTRKMQMIFQDPISSLNPRMTVQEIVSEGLIINKVFDNLTVDKVIVDKKTGELKTIKVKAPKSVIENRIKKEVINALELVGLAPEYISRYPHEFSGGQRQRIGIARALIMNPSIIVADEPISALDVSIKAQVINLLSELKDRLDLTILFIAHDLSVIKYFCDRIAVMYFGKMVEMATAEELFKNPLHGYTKALLSAIPHPDPDSEKERKRIPYSPMVHDYSVDKPEFVEITPGHFIYANQKELEDMRKKLGVEQ